MGYRRWTFFTAHLGIKSLALAPVQAAIDSHHANWDERPADSSENQREDKNRLAARRKSGACRAMLLRKYINTNRVRRSASRSSPQFFELVSVVKNWASNRLRMKRRLEMHCRQADFRAEVDQGSRANTAWCGLRGSGMNLMKCQFQRSVFNRTLSSPSLPLSLPVRRSSRSRSSTRPRVRGLHLPAQQLCSRFVSLHFCLAL